MPSPLARAVEPSPEPEPETEARATLRALVEQALRHARETVTPPPEGEKHVVLDVEHDGFRCLIVATGAAPGRRETPLLSPREQEIARMVARGMPNKAIAAVLEISTWTVGTYLRRMFAKLGVSSRAAMIAKLMEPADRRIR